ncbi:type III PLP-dependent enzyme [Mesoaciditoga sp.]
MEITKKVRFIAKKVKTPFVLMDLDIVESNYRRLKDAIPGVKIFYAVKSNSHERVVNKLRDLGSSFDVASKGEIKKLIGLGIDPSMMSFGNTIKKEEDIKFAYENGIDLFAVDAEMEIEKIARNAPHSKVYFRLAMGETDSDWPLSKKFGTNIEHVKDLIIYAFKLGLQPIGVSFHVGSQCYDKYSWQIALMKVADIFWFARLQGIKMNVINLGGGMPIKYVRDIPTVEEIGEVINESIEEYFNFMDRPTLYVEPGRSMVGDAGILVSKVILRSKKDMTNWVYLDAGVFHGLMETIEDLRYKVVVDGKEGHQKKIFTLAGPTCDSVDVIYDEVELPEDISLNDTVYFLNAGAYTVDYGTNFNGIEKPKEIFMEDFSLEEQEEELFAAE